MKKIFLTAALIGFGFLITCQAQYIKDDCQGKRINFGFAFAPTFDWMYPKTEGYERRGMVVGMRYGIPINVNLTKDKFYYVSTGVFMEHIGGIMAFRDKIIYSDIINVNSAETYRHYRATYLTIPVGITLKTKSLSNFFICGNAGFYNSLLLWANQQDTYNLSGELWSREKGKATEVSIVKEAAYAGLGFEYSITKDFRAGVMVNYVHTLTNYFKGKGQAQNSLTKLDQKAHIGYVELEAHINFF